MTTELLIGIAEWLDAEAVAGWHPDGAYVVGEVATVLRAFPSEPDRLISLATYGVDDHPTMPTDVIGLQVRTRGDKADVTDVDDIADAVYDLLHGAKHQDVNDVHIDACYRRSWTPLGTDENGRPERSDNYYLTIARPTQHRNP